MSESKGILPNQSKGKYIPYSVEQLKEFREKDKFAFVEMIKSNDWLKYIYSGDWEHNARLNYIRMFYYKEYRGIKRKTPPSKQSEQIQLPLL
jgi:hypothetical protein